MVTSKCETKEKSFFVSCDFERGKSQVHAYEESHNKNDMAKVYEYHTLVYMG